MEISRQALSWQETKAIGQEIGRRLKGGELIILDGDLGSGKTTFVTGLASGATSDSDVSSPSFVIKNEYKCPGFIINHYDFYRLNDAGIMTDALNENLNKNDVSVIEWSDLVSELLARDRLVINFKVLSETGRILSMSAPKTLEYLIKDLTN